MNKISKLVFSLVHSFIVRTSSHCWFEQAMCYQVLRMQVYLKGVSKSSECRFTSKMCPKSSEWRFMSKVCPKFLGMEVYVKKISLVLKVCLYYPNKSRLKSSSLIALGDDLGCEFFSYMDGSIINGREHLKHRLGIFLMVESIMYHFLFCFTRIKLCPWLVLDQLQNISQTEKVCSSWWN